jgi:hypothetical protein
MPWNVGGTVNEARERDLSPSGPYYRYASLFYTAHSRQIVALVAERSIL